MLTIRYFAPPALLAVALATPAAAQTYVGASAGATFHDTSKDNGAFTATVPATASFPAIPSGTPLSLETRYDTGFNISGVIGHRFSSGFRIEAEFAYDRAKIDRHSNLAAGGTVIDGLDVAVLTRGAPSASNPAVGAVIADGADGRTENLSALANVYYDFNSKGRLSPYLGAGIGVSRVSVRYAPSDVPVSRGRTTELAYQGIAGVTWKASPGFELFGQYAYRGTTDPEIDVQLVPARWKVNNRQSIVSLGFRIPLGAGNRTER